MRRGTGALAMALALGAATAANAQSFDNRSVMALHRAGLGPDVIIAKIRALPCNYDTSTEAIIALSSAGVAQDVIVAMVDKCTGSSRAQGVNNASADPLVKHAPGIYLLESAQPAKMTMLRPAASAGLKVTGNGSILFPLMAKLTVTQAQAQTVIHGSRPTFYFYFNADDEKVNTFGTVGSAAAQSPNEFSLVKFRVDKNTRQFVVGRVQPYVEVVGVDPKNTLPFDAEDMGDGIFRIQFAADLPAGEYAFVLPGGKTSFRIYDFSIP
ncbi:hypothetical protein ACFOD9_02695 [Novosphingobium bradum]|uniref:DUF4198 domain-containing protein n=1 Tax=Novosphingobium bradum TaxID=1737444 RepID=A0ABV7ILQ7_9SPHN